MCKTKSERSCDILQESHLMLSIGCKGIDVFVDVARGGIQIILAPISPEDSGRVRGQSQDGLQLSVHHALFLRLHIVAYSIILRSDIILLAITETIDGKVGLKGVFT